jgi:hypothetical protein
LWEKNLEAGGFSQAFKEGAFTLKREYGFINAKMKNHEHCLLAKLIKYILPIHFRFD